MKLLMILVAIGVVAAGAQATAPADVIKVGPGESIQAAIDAADPGDTIEVKKGVYLEKLEVGTDGLTLKGKGAIIDAELRGACITVWSDDVTITGFRLVNGIMGIDASPIHSLHKIPKGDGGGAPIPDHAHRLRVIDNEVIGAALVGGILVWGESAVIEGNTVIGANGFGIHYRHYGDPGRTVIAKNTVRNTRYAHCAVSLPGASGPEPAGFGIDAAGPLLDIVSNRVEGNEFAGINVRVWSMPGAEGVPAARILRNTASDNGCEADVLIPTGAALPDHELMHQDGIHVEDLAGLGTLVEKNVAHRNADDGIHVVGEAFEVIGNKTSWNNDDGIEAAADDSRIHKNTATGNLDDGLRVTFPTSPPDGGDLVLVGNRVTNNSACENSDDGIQTEGPNHLIAGNKANENVQNGIIVTWGDRVTVRSNQANKNGQQGISNGSWMADILFNKAKGNACGIGPDIAGKGTGKGVVDEWHGNQFDTGGRDVEDRCMDYLEYF
jgi:hypothetical protein